MSTLDVNSIISDNDPRMASRTLRVTRIDGEFVYANTGSGRGDVRIKRKSVHTDGKPRRTGFSLVLVS